MTRFPHGKTRILPVVHKILEHRLDDPLVVYVVQNRPGPVVDVPALWNSLLNIGEDGLTAVPHPITKSRINPENLYGKEP